MSDNSTVAKAIGALMWGIVLLVVMLLVLAGVIVWATLQVHTGQPSRPPLVPTRELTRNDSLLLFFGLFWVISVNSLPQYRLFETHRLRGARLKRFAVGLILADIMPVLILAASLAWLPKGPLHVPGGVLSAAAAALSLFGLRRIIHGILIFTNLRFFDDDEQELRANLTDARWGRSSRSHLISGVVWMVILWAAAFVLALLGL